MKLKMILSILFVVFSVIGLSDALYLTYNEFNHIVPPCNMTGFACETVLQSKWAHIGSIPIPVFGMGYYTTVLILAVLHLTEVDMRKFGRSVVRALGIRSRQAISKHPLSHLTAFDGLAFLSGFGFLFSLYLVFLMAFMIKAWCIYCLVSAASSAMLFLSTRAYMATTESSPVFTHFFTAEVVSWLYKNILKRVFFSFDPELVHNTIVGVGAVIGNNPATRVINQALLSFRNPSLAKTVDGITFPNPIGLAAGFDYNADLTQTLPGVGFGFQTVGTVTLEPYGGNIPPRLTRYPNSQALLVNKGFKSLGAKAVTSKLTGLNFDIPVGISIGSTNKTFSEPKAQILDILQTFMLFESSAVRHAYYELNISCPNTRGGQPFTTPDRLEVLLTALDHIALQRPVYIKMPINLADDEIRALLKVADTHEIAGVIFGNLTKDKERAPMDENDRSHWQTASGYVSGKPTWERSNHLIKLARKHYPTRFTIIGTGGIFTPEDAVKKLHLGADLVQLITGMIYQGPQVIGQIANYMHRAR